MQANFAAELLRRRPVQAAVREGEGALAVDDVAAAEELDLGAVGDSELWVKAADLGVLEGDEAIWRDVCLLLRQPERIEKDYDRRLDKNTDTSPARQSLTVRISSLCGQRDRGTRTYQAPAGLFFSTCPSCRIGGRRTAQLTCRGRL